MELIIKGTAEEIKKVLQAIASSEEFGIYDRSHKWQRSSSLESR